MKFQINNRDIFILVAVLALSGFVIAGFGVITKKTQRKELQAEKETLLQELYEEQRKNGLLWQELVRLREANKVLYEAANKGYDPRFCHEVRAGLGLER